MQPRRSRHAGADLRDARPRWASRRSCSGDDLLPGPAGRRSRPGLARAGVMWPLAGQRTKHPGDTEASLIARAKAGDSVAFEQLSSAYADRIFMLLLRLLGDRGDAEDVAQEVMLRAWRAIGAFRGTSSYFTWLYRIAVNEA